MPKSKWKLTDEEKLITALSKCQGEGYTTQDLITYCRQSDMSRRTFKDADLIRKAQSIASIGRKNGYSVKCPPRPPRVPRKTKAQLRAEMISAVFAKMSDEQLKHYKAESRAIARRTAKKTVTKKASPSKPAKKSKKTETAPKKKPEAPY